MNVIFIIVLGTLLVGGGLITIYAFQIQPFYTMLTPLWMIIMPFGEAIGNQLSGLWTTFQQNPLAMIIPALTASGALIAIFSQIKSQLDAKAMHAEAEAIQAQQSTGAMFGELQEAKNEITTLNQKLKVYENGDLTTSLKEAQDLVVTKEAEVTKLKNQVETLSQLYQKVKLAADETIVKTVVK